MKFESDVLMWPLAAYGTVIRGDETTSEDQVGTAVTPDVARRIAACWNACAGISTDDLVYGNYKDRIKKLEDILRKMVQLNLGARREPADDGFCFYCDARLDRGLHIGDCPYQEASRLLGE